jgi:FAD/FMN-containing dehydrogenase
MTTDAGAPIELRVDLAARAAYAEGAGISRAVPRAVAVPRDADEVRALVRWARERGEPLIPRGSGSGMPGGNVGDGTIVDLSRIAWREPIDVEARRTRVGPGAIVGEVDAAARAQGLRLPVDPSSAPFCTVGGAASTNAAGAHTLRHGAMRAWVTALDCVFDDGARATLRRGEPPPREIAAVRRFLDEASADVRIRGARMRHDVRKDTSGYALAEYARSGELVDLIVGSEGTLALIVGIELALAPVATATASVLAAFHSLDDAVTGAGLARDAGAAACELLDRTFLDVAREGGALTLPVPLESEAVLLIELEGDDEAHARRGAETLATRLREGCASYVALGLDAGEQHALWELRHAASPILSRLDPSLASMQFIEDGCVPPERLADYVRGVREALARHETRGVIFGHAGDAHVHVNPLIDVSREGWRDRVRGILADVVALTARLGGTLAGEHGDGRLRTALLATTRDEEARDRRARGRRAGGAGGRRHAGG